MDTASFSKQLNQAKTESKLALLEVFESRIQTLASKNATKEEVINDLLFFTKERKALSQALMNSF